MFGIVDLARRNSMGEEGIDGSRGESAYCLNWRFKNSDNAWTQRFDCVYVVSKSSDATPGSYEYEDMLDESAGLERFVSIGVVLTRECVLLYSDLRRRSIA